MLAKISLNSCSKAELRELASSLGEKPFRADQLFRWLHAEKILNIEEMSNLSKQFRTHLGDMAEITSIKEIAREKSRRDGSIKFLFELADKETVESVLLVDGGRVTACISTQAGCKMGCKFCATAKIGFRRNLNTAEILEQVRLLEITCATEGLTAEGRLTNIVFMGMGEPLDNIDNLLKSLNILMADDGYGYSHRRLTVSTSGITPKIKSLFELDTPVKLAVSINAPNQTIRQEIMPISAKYPLSELLKELGRIPVQKKRMITLEYVLLGGVNDSQEHAKAFVKLVKGLPVKINLIRWNPGAEGEFKKPDEKNVLAFQKILMDNNLTAFIRKSLGSDIRGACGQLRGSNKED